MPIQVNELSGLQDINQALGALFNELNDFKLTLPPSLDPASEFLQIEALTQKISDLQGEIAILGLREIDQAIGQSNLVADINALSAEAKQEAETIHATAASIQAAADVISSVAGVVTKIAGLPFL